MRPSSRPSSAADTNVTASGQAARPVTITFLLAQPVAGRVAVSGQFNHWSADSVLMNRGSDGCWQATLALPPGRYEYKFVVDGQWIPDPNAPEQVPDGYGATNSVIQVGG